MKRKILAGAFCLIAYMAEAQLRVGGNMRFGKSTIQSKESFENYLSFIKSSDSITNTSLTQEGKGASSLGVLAEYGLSDNLSVGGELNFLSQKSTSEISISSYKEEQGGIAKTTISETTSSEAEIKISSFNIPTYLKYTYKSDKIGFFGYAGFFFDLRLKKEIVSDENFTSSTYNSVSKNTTTEKKNYKATASLNGYSSFATGLLFGFGVQYELGPGNIFIDFRYQATAKSNLNTTDATFYNNTRNNRLYSEIKQQDIKVKNGIDFNDFQNKQWTIGLGYFIEL